MLFRLLQIPVDFALSFSAFLIGYHLRTIELFPGIQPDIDLKIFPPLSQYVPFVFIAVIMFIGVLATNKAYSLKVKIKFFQGFKKIINSSLIWLTSIIAYFFIIHELPFSRLVLAYSWILSIVFVICGHLFIDIVETILLRYGIGNKRLLFIGGNQTTEKLAKIFQNNQRYNIIGFIDETSKKSQFLKHLGMIKDIGKIIQKHHIDEVIQTNSTLSHTKAADIVSFCREHHIIYRFVPDLLNVYKTNFEVETSTGIPIISLNPTPIDGWGRIFKRCFDFIIALISIILLSPVFIIIGIAIKLDSKGTIFFKYLDDGTRVKRVGENEKTFHFYKFRTMYPNTHNLRYTKLAKKNLREGSPLVKIQDDPRVTRVGKFLRKTSFDELPQLLNVLTGEMSLVGPRPHLPEEVEKYQKHHKFVLTIKPGITGLAQISGRSDLNFEEEIRLDTYYIENWSPWLDLKIILKTPFILLKSYKE